MQYIFDRVLPRLDGLVTRALGDRIATFEYPYDPRPRYGHGHPSHPALERAFQSLVPEIRANLQLMGKFGPQLLAIPHDSDAARPHEPHWANGWLPALDAVSLYAAVANGRPGRYMEVGSGNSTKFAARAKRDFAIGVEITSIDPWPRAEIDVLCDEVIRAPLEATDLRIFDDLDSGDILFIDNSHRSFQNSDVTVFFLEVLPNLKPGVIVGIHDIFLPNDYPPSWKRRWYNEQYLLAACLLSRDPGFRVTMPNAFVTGRPDLHQELSPLWAALARQDLHLGGAAFWIVKT